MSISGSNHTVAERLREGILRSCFGPFEGRLASGMDANNILDLQKLNAGWPELAALAINQTTRIARKFDPRPDAIVPVPNGANWIGRGVSGALGLGDPWILDKDPDGRISAERLATAFAAAERLLLVEDIFTRGTNTSKVLELPEVGERAVGLVAVWDRGDPAQRPGVGVPVRAVIQEYIPPELPPESTYWGYLPDARIL